jgi:endoribonuclease Dicer
MVSNQFLSSLAVVLGLDQLFSVNNVKLRMAVDEYAREIRELRVAFPESPDFWRKAKKPVPKALADQVEATLGAMLVDSNFDFAPIETFFFTHVEPFFRDIALYDGFANKHPTSLIYKTVSGHYGCRRFRVEVRHRTTGELVMDEEEYELPEDERITATVMIHRKVVGFADGVSSRYAKVRASAMALRALEGLSRAEFRELTACYCGEKEGDVEAELEDLGEEA